MDKEYILISFTSLSAELKDLKGQTPGVQGNVMDTHHPIEQW
jgi:hypothetical protein